MENRFEICVYYNVSFDQTKIGFICSSKYFKMWQETNVLNRKVQHIFLAQLSRYLSLCLSFADENFSKVSSKDYEYIKNMFRMSRTRQKLQRDRWLQWLQKIENRDAINIIASSLSLTTCVDFKIFFFNLKIWRVPFILRFVIRNPFKFYFLVNVWFWELY